MNRRLLLILICALIGGASASYLVYRFVGGGSGPAPLQTSQIVVATRDLGVGTLIGPGDLRMGSWVGALPKGALAKLDAALNRGAVANMYEGEPINSDRLAATGSGGGLAAIIPPGMRATAVRVDEVVGLAGFVAPGMRVDVLMTGIPPGGSPAEGSHVNTLLQNIQVLSAGVNLQKDSEGKPQQAQVVNLLVTPEQAERLTLASSQTRIQLILRNPLDTQPTNAPGAHMSELFGFSLRRPPGGPEASREASAEGKAGTARAASTRTGQRAASPPPAPPPPRPAEVPPKIRIVEVFNGSVRTEVKFTLQENSP